MFNALTKRNKILIIIALILFVVAVPLTIIQVQKQQEIRQRAAEQDTSLYFTKKDSASPLTNGSLTSGQSDNLSLWIDTKGNSINGFSITISATNLTFSSPIAGPDASSFNLVVTDVETKSNNTLIFEKFDTRNKVIVGQLHLIDFTVTAGTVGNGNITVTSAKITPPKDLTQQYLSSENPSFSYTIVTASDSPTPTPTPTSTPAPTPGSSCQKNGQVGITQQDGTCFVIGPNPTVSFLTTPTSTPTPTPTPTSTPSPTPTLIPPGKTFAKFKIALSGIVDNPKHTTRKLKIEVFDPLDNNAKIADLATDITHDPLIKQFKGTNVLDAISKSGIYNIKVKSDGYLRKLILPIQINLGQENNLGLVNLIPGDIDGDNKIDLIDYNLFISCYGTKADKPTCDKKVLQLSDFNDDIVIDGIDYNTFIKGLSVKDGD